MSEEEQLPEEQCKRVRVSRSLKVRSEKMTQSNTYSPQGVRNTFRVPEGGMAIEVSNNKEISGGRKNGEKNRFCHLSKKSKRGSINIDERERESGSYLVRC